MKKPYSSSQRPRRIRTSSAIRNLVRECVLSSDDLVAPLFVVESKDQALEVSSMPGVYRLTVDQIRREVASLRASGIQAVALFPNLQDHLKDARATESLNPDGLVQQVTRAIKLEVPEMCVITDVAMDPYSSDGHDGLLVEGSIDNDLTLPILADMAINQAAAGADCVAPSDMMDGRVGYIRQRLDEAGFSNVLIISYAAKYCSAFYGPFRDALDSAPRGGDKKTYQMDPSNRREALKEVRLDIEQGADIVMVKPALSYLDVISDVRQSCDCPVAAYNVSGEYAMVKAAALQGWINEDEVVKEILTSIKRAGADMIFTYHAKDIAEKLFKNNS